MAKKLKTPSNVQLFKDVLSKKKKSFPRGYWKSDDVDIKVKEILMYLFEKELEWDKDIVSNRFSKNVLINYGLRSILTAYDYDLQKIIDVVYGNIKLKEKEPYRWTSMRYH